MIAFIRQLGSLYRSGGKISNPHIIAKLILIFEILSENGRAFAALLKCYERIKFFTLLRSAQVKALALFSPRNVIIELAEAMSKRLHIPVD